MNTNGHYDVLRNRYDEIIGLTCTHCVFTVSRYEYLKGTDRSGLPRYNRMRGKIVKHLHDEHLDELAATSAERRPRCER